MTTTNANQGQSKLSVLPFVRGGISGVLSWLVIHPADVVKVRMQIAGEGTKETPYKGFIQAARVISKSEGVSALYSGLSAALTRQISYTTLRLGLYSSLRDHYAKDGNSISMGAKFAVGTAAGGIASAISTPVEVSMVRMYSDGAAEASKRRGYRNIFDALWRIAKEEGISGLWRGATPTVTRSMVANCVQLGTYDQAKEVFSETGINFLQEGVSLHLAASITSGFCYSVVTLPIDSAKTRVQNQRPVNGVMPYRSLFHAMVKVASLEGAPALWKGFTPYFSRCAGHTVVMFLVLEQVKKIFIITFIHLTATYFEEGGLNERYSSCKRLLQCRSILSLSLSLFGMLSREGILYLRCGIESRLVVYKGLERKKAQAQLTKG
ncbi:unnamed protein product [Agarophyton chilense]